MQIKEKMYNIRQNRVSMIQLGKARQGNIWSGQVNLSINIRLIRSGQVTPVKAKQGKT